VKKVSSIEEIQSFWDKFSSNYNNIEPSMNSYYYTLASMLRIEQRKAILEVGAGSGYLYNHSLALKKHNAAYVATDISDAMLEILC